MRRSRAREAFVTNLHDSRAVLATKIEGFLYLTHLWAGEAMHFNEPLQIVYVSSRQATDPGAGVPGYVLANYSVLALPRILSINLGKRADLVRAFSIALPFVRTGMTEAYAENAKVFGRWQPRMLTSREAAHALLQLLSRPASELDDKIYQLNVVKIEGELPVRLTWSEIQLAPLESQLAWSNEQDLLLPEKAAEGE